MDVLNQRSFLFCRPPRRRRIAHLLLALSFLTALNAVFIAARAQDDPFTRLGERPSLVGRSLADDGRGRFSVVGGSEEFEFIRQGRRATIRFLCSPSPRCTDAMRQKQSLDAEPTGRGDYVFKSKDGKAVLRVTATGGATLFGGASFVPTSVPKSGRAVVPVS